MQGERVHGDWRRELGACIHEAKGSMSRAVGEQGGGAGGSISLGLRVGCQYVGRKDS